PKRGYATSATLEKVIDRPTQVETTDNRVVDVQAFWDYQYLFMSQRSEAVDPIVLKVVEGSVPADLEGTYYLGGPGLFADDHGSCVHPLDGHGYIKRFRIQSGSVSYSARYIDTEARKEEYDEKEDNWRFTYRGPFSVLKGGERFGNVRVMKNTANTSVLSWGGRLLCLWEGGQPYQVDSQSLRTLGLFRFLGMGKENSNAKEKDIIPKSFLGRANINNLFMKGILKLSSIVLHPILSGIFKMPAERMLSHYKIDAKRQRLIVMTCHAQDMLLPESNFTVYEFDSSMNLVQQKKFLINDHMMIHDWALSENYYIIFGNRIKLDIGGSAAAVSGLRPMISALTLNPSCPHTPVYLLPRFTNKATEERDWRIPVQIPKQFWLMHTANAYEEITDPENGTVQIVVQACISTYKWFSFEKMFGYDWTQRRLDPKYMNNQPLMNSNEEVETSHLVQVTIQLNNKYTHSNGCSTIVESFKGWEKPCDFPTINPAVSGYKNRFSYVAACSGKRRSLQHFPFDTVIKLEGPKDSALTWSAGNRSFVGEPIFVSKRGSSSSNLHDFVEDNGYILVVEYAVSEQRCYLVILDAQRIGGKNALVAKLEVPKEYNFPLGFHGFWVDEQDNHV
ncbi:hypothetical protein SUGI_0589450, partial [Cryptomeria japonica]